MFWPLISPQGDGNDSSHDVALPAAGVLALNFPARGRKPGVKQFAGTFPCGVLALNFPARGRKLDNCCLCAVGIGYGFWPLISPQGDGNVRMENCGAPRNGRVLALNFPARGRKPNLNGGSKSPLFTFWPLISPQGDGNGGFGLPNKLPVNDWMFWPLISPQGDGNHARLKKYNGVKSIVLALNFPARGRKLEIWE